MLIRSCSPNVSQASETPSVFPHGLKSLESVHLFRKYDVLKCVYWITFNKYERVCLQFPDELLSEAVATCSLIEERVKRKLYIMADSSYGSCCVDYISANHVNADAVIHFGSSCLSATNEIPTLYVFPKEYLDVKSSCETIQNFCKDIATTVVVLYDVAYDHYADDFLCYLSPTLHNVRVSRIAVPQQKKESTKVSTSDHIVTKFGRYFSLPQSVQPDEVTFIYLTPDLRKRNFENFVLTCRNLTFYRYCGERPGILEKSTLPNAVKSRLHDIHRVKEAERIGILVSTLSTDKYLDAIERIKTLCRLTKKRSYIFSFGKISPEKLANFPEISLFVLIGCPEATISNKKDYFQPIVGMMEFEMALNNNELDWRIVVNDYREFLPGGSQYQDIDEERIRSSAANADVSLLSNTVIGGIDCSSSTETTVASRGPLTVAEYAGTSPSDGRTWQGLQPDVGNTPVEKATIGLRGTPSSGYEHPSSYQRTEENRFFLHLLYFQTNEGNQLVMCMQNFQRKYQFA